MLSAIKNFKVVATIIVALVACVKMAFAAPTATKSSYQLSPLDVLQVKVYNEPDLDTIYKISADGFVVMPLIGQVKVGGLTVSAAQAKMKELFEKDYLVTADVSIFVMEYAPRRVYVIGQVNRPGEALFPPEEGLTLSKAIAGAGGTTRIAKDRGINVKRKLSDGTIRVFEVDLKAILNDKNATDFPLQDGDTIEVQESAF